MKKNFTSILLAILFLSCTNSIKKENYLKLWYDKPAKAWTEALPVGNGRLGAMVFGNPAEEKLQLNELTVWAGQPHRNDNPAAKTSLSKVRKLIFNDKYKEAQDLINKTFFSHKSDGMPYQTVGDLNLSFAGQDNYTSYYRDLDIENAVATTKYQIDGVNYKREVFSSYPDQVIVVKLTADKPGKISFIASMTRPAEVKIETKDDNQLIMSGITGNNEGIQGAVKFQARAKIINNGGSNSTTDTSVVISDADDVTILISIASSFNNYKDISGNSAERAEAYLSKAANKNYDTMLANHITDYQKYFNKVSINLGITDSVKNPTNIRIKQFAQSNDPQLVELYFQYGRYLLVSSSRPGGQPANLQGLWNNQLFPPWDSKYTININTEMNYWPSEPTNLTEMNEPLIQMVKELSEAGKKTARDMYGADGWVAHHNTDIWRVTGPIDGAFWGMWPMGGAWLSQHLYEKYEYNGDVEYLKSVYPVMKSACEFYLSFLVEEPKNQWLVVSPSVSPENAPSVHSGESIGYGTTMDNQLLFDLFTKTIKSANILNVDTEFISKVQTALDKLPPMQIGQYGQLQEWIEDWDNPKDDHRHVSHLYGVFPSNQISLFRTPKLFDAARTSLIYRGDPSTGWSMNWKINLWASFFDGNHAYKLIRDQIQLVEGRTFKGGTYPNMFDAHPPFQIDGNFGFTSGVTEMLMQSKDGAIFVLPALPDVWPKGSIKGLRARGGFEIIELTWNESKVTKLVVKSNLGGNCRVRSYNQLKGNNLADAAGINTNRFYETPSVKEPLISEKANLNNIEIKDTYLYDIETEAGETYTFTGI